MIEVIESLQGETVEKGRNLSPIVLVFRQSGLLGQSSETQSRDENGRQGNPAPVARGLLDLRVDVCFRELKHGGAARGEVHERSFRDHLADDLLELPVRHPLGGDLSQVVHVKLGLGLRFARKVVEDCLFYLCTHSRSPFLTSGIRIRGSYAPTKNIIE